jgi:glycosyltransferase involved in cell wall biosynthesis
MVAGYANSLRGSSRPNRIKILRIIARMNLGGPAIQISGLYHGMDTHEFETVLVTGFCESNEIDYLLETDSQIPTIRLTGLGRSISIIKDFGVFLNLLRIIRSERPHIIHTHTAKAGFLGRLASIMSFHNSVRVHTFHGHLLKGYFGPIQTKVVIALEKFLAFFTNHLIAVGVQVRDDLIVAGIGNARKFSVFPPGVEHIDVLDRKLERASQKIGLDTTVISFIGRVEQIKRPDRFLDVVQLVSKSCNNVLFIVAGEGALLEEMKERSKNLNLEIRFVGWVTEISRVLSVSDIVVLTSENEGIPMSLIQSSFSRVPSVATNVGSVSSVVVNNKTGILCSEDVSEIASAVTDLVRDSSRRSRLGNGALLHAEENFHVSRLVRDHEILYRKLTEGQSN